MTNVVLPDGAVFPDGKIDLRSFVLGWVKTGTGADAPAHLVAFSPSRGMRLMCGRRAPLRVALYDSTGWWVEADNQRRRCKHCASQPRSELAAFIRGPRR